MSCLCVHEDGVITCPANGISPLAQAVTNVKEESGERVDAFALKVPRAFPRLHAEATRTAALDQNPKAFAWDVFMTASLEAGLQLHIRSKMIREDPAHAFQASRARAKNMKVSICRENPHATLSSDTVSSITGHTHDCCQVRYEFSHELKHLSNEPNYLGFLSVGKSMTALIRSSPILISFADKM